MDWARKRSEPLERRDLPNFDAQLADLHRAGGAGALCWGAALGVVTVAPGSRAGRLPVGNFLTDDRTGHRLGADLAVDPKSALWADQLTPGGGGHFRAGVDAGRESGALCHRVHDGLAVR